MSAAKGIRGLAPSFATLFFAGHVALALGRARGALGDPGTGWHLTTGRLILETGAVPRHDVFSFTAPGRPWVDYYWLFEALSAWLVRLGGLPAYGAACMLVYALVPALLLQRMLRDGANPLAALVVMPFAYVVLLSHAIARPHVVTYVFAILVLDRLDAVRRGARPAVALWWLPALTALWCNLHGGFAAGIALVGTAAGAAAVRWAAFREPADAREALAFAALTVAMTLATLVNPYGAALPIDVVHHLGMTSTAYFVEFRSPDFHQGGASVAAFEALVLGLVVVLALGPSRFAWSEIVLAVVTLHWALVAQRNMNLFVLVAAPMLARGLTPVLAAGAPALAARWRDIGVAQARMRSGWAWIPALSVLVMALAARGATAFPTTLDGARLSAGAARYVAADLDRFARPFNTDALGGALIHRFWPALHVFVDDRTFVYGDDFVVHDYFTVLYGRPGWQSVLDRWGVTTAIVATATTAEAVLRASPAWTVEYEDADVVILARAGAAAP